MFSERIKNLRRVMNLPQNIFAGIVGVRPTEISRWENGHSKPHWRTQNTIDRIEQMKPAERKRMVAEYLKAIGKAEVITVA